MFHRPVDVLFMSPWPRCICLIDLQQAEVEEWWFQFVFDVHCFINTALQCLQETKTVQNFSGLYNSLFNYCTFSRGLCHRSHWLITFVVFLYSAFLYGAGHCCFRMNNSFSLMLYSYKLKIYEIFLAMTTNKQINYQTIKQPTNPINQSNNQSNKQSIKQAIKQKTNHK